MDLDNMKLPKVNLIKQKVNQNQTGLKLEILKTIQRVEEELGYEFHSYEVDNVLLDIIKTHHQDYLNLKFGFDTIG